MGLKKYVTKKIHRGFWVWILGFGFGFWVWAGELVEAKDQLRTADCLDENTALEQNTRGFGFDSNWSFHSQMLDVP